MPIRRHLFVLLHVLTLGLLPAAQGPADSVALELFDNAPNLEELAFLEELSTWIREDPRAAQQPAAEAIRASQDSFDLFLSFHDETLRHQRLASFPFSDTIRDAADRHGLDPLLVVSVIEAESSFNPEAMSRQGALGLMQVMPALHNLESDHLRDPSNNIEHGTRYLRGLLERFDGDLELALAAYNAGPGNVRRYGGVPPFRETRRYVEKVLDLYIDHHRTVWQDTETGELLATG